MNSDTYIYI